MKYLFLSNSIGGLISFRAEIIQKIIDQGDTVHICTPLEIRTSYFESKGCFIHPIKLARHGTNPYYDLNLLHNYIRIVKSIQPDIIFSYTIKPNIYGSIAAKKCKVPIIASVTGLGTAIEGKGWLSKISRFLMKCGMKATNHVFFQNKESMDFFTQHNIKLKSKSLVAGSGVNLKRFKFSPYPEENDGIHFLYTGRILKEKGIGLFLDAAEIIKKEFPSTYFHIVGIKDDVEYSFKVEKFHNKGIIIFHGSQRDVRPFIVQSHCQIHPTYYPEGMSNVLLESAATGRPAITTDKSGCKEIVEDNKTGFIIKQNDLQSLVNAIRNFILLSHEEKKNMGLKAHIKVANEFDRNKVITEYLTVAQNIIKSYHK